MNYFINTQGSYYEGDRVSALDIIVPQRPSVYSTWDGAQWQTPDAATIQDTKAQAFADAVDKVQFRLLFNLENRVRALEGKLALTAAQYRQAVIDQWKLVNP